jgi:hypothetical protein
MIPTSLSPEFEHLQPASQLGVLGFAVLPVHSCLLPDSLKKSCPAGADFITVVVLAILQKIILMIVLRRVK